MLREQEIEVEVRGHYGLPETLEEMASFDAIILADLPATSLTPRQMQMVKRYVTDLGGGLVMMGSENSFGLGGYYKTPVEDVLPLISRFEKEKEKPSLAMVLVIDKSGSMTGVPIAARAAGRQGGGRAARPARHDRRRRLRPRAASRLRNDERRRRRLGAGLDRFAAKPAAARSCTRRW